ncbi:MAG: hypothetical protein E6K84_05105 [Thaumarchaeota archaeon]|nr:MAG: hypothetical protein E6K84_05105 [Nitrososphaerota archaeon]
MLTSRESEQRWGTTRNSSQGWVRAVKSATGKPVFAKLSPNTERIPEVARAAVDEGVDGITAINTVRATMIDVETQRPVLSHRTGGLSGSAIRPIAHAVQFLLAAPPRSR